MIVNTAYPFMGKQKPLADPYLFGNGVVNVPYELYSAAWQPSYGFGVNANGWVLLTVPAKGYNKITFKINAASSAGGKCVITFLTADGAEISSITQNTTQYQKDYTFDIPTSAKKDGIKVKFEAKQVYHYLRNGTLVE